MNNTLTDPNVPPPHGGIIYGLPAIIGLVALTIVIFGGVAWHLRRERIAQQKKTEDDQAPSSDMFDRVAPKMSFAILKDKMQSETGVTFHQGTHLVCAICLETIKDDESVRQLPCGHVFHAASIVKWFRRGHQWCPLCASPLNPPVPVSTLPV
jgi:hypothetical protein